MITERIKTILISVSRRVQELIPSERFYVLFYDNIREQIEFPLVRIGGLTLFGDQSPWLLRSIIRGDILPDWIISHEKGLLVENEFANHLQQRQMRYWPDGPVPTSWLATPMTIGGQVSGALVIENWHETSALDKDDLRVLSTIARQTANAIENARLYEQLERKIKHLQILNHVGQQLTKGLANQEQEILELVYNSITELEVDTQNIYIVFYKPDSMDTTDEIFGQLSFVLAFDEGMPITIPNRRAGKGLTEYVIRTKLSFNPLSVEQAYQQIAEDQIGKIPLSWLGVPMISDGRVFGVIVLRNNDFENAYTQEDQEILEILAGQAAVALLVHSEQKKRIEFERIFAMGNMAAEFAHKMNNIAGTIPVRIDLARKQLALEKPSSIEIEKQLNRIEVEANSLLYGAQEIRKAIELGETRASEEVKVNELIEIAIARARNARFNLESQVETKTKLAQGLPSLILDRNALLDTLTNIIKNGFEAIEQSGVLEISTRLIEIDKSRSIEIEIIDNGKGIPPTQLPKIFELFYTTKGDKGLGFGLWRDKVFIKKIGGDIDVYSEENHGSTFAIRIPVVQNVQ